MIEKDFLYKEYIVNNRSSKEISKKVGKSDTQVRYWLKKHNIPIKPRGGRYKSIDLKNRTFGELTVIKQVSGNGNCAIWQCECSCGNLHLVKSPCLRNGEIKSCGKCLEHYNWKGYGELSGHYFAIIKQRAKKKNIVCAITKKFLWELFIKQKRLCALSGIKLYFARSYGSTEQTASLDRIDSSKGYTQDNVQWVHKDINKIKRDYSEKQFFNFIKHIYEYRDLDGFTEEENRGGN